MSGNTSNCKPANSHPAPLQEAQAFSVQQTGDKPANIAQLAATPVASAASPPLGRSPDQFPMQDALETQAYAQLPAGDANHIPASAALPAADQAPMYQAVSPQAGTQTSSPQKSPHTIPVYQAEVADPCLGVQNQGCPELVVATSSSMPSMPGVPGEATLALADPSTCNAQLPGTTSAASAQQGGKLPPGLPMQTEDHMPDPGENSNDSRKSADHQTAVGNLSNPSPANDQPQFEPTPVAAAAAAAGTVETEPGMLAAQTDFLVKAEPESDTSMEDANKRSAADVFEETVMQCKKVVSEASSILLNRESEGAGGGRTCRIAASERATMWHNELQGLLKRCKMPQLYIGVLGDTGGHLSLHHALQKDLITLGTLSAALLSLFSHTNLADTAFWVSTMC